VKDQTVISLTAIGSVTILQCIAWAFNHNGTVFALTSAIIGGITGFSINKVSTHKK